MIDKVKVHKLTRKEINIIYGYLYDCQRFNNYTEAYLNSEYVYDVIDRDSQIQIYYEHTFPWKLPISVLSLYEFYSSSSPQI